MAVPSQTEPRATATPVIITRQDPEQAKRGQGAPSECALVTAGDVASIFSAETNQPMFGSGPVDRAAFSGVPITANESYCTFLAFHQSASAKGSYNQITYWVDTPEVASQRQWAQAWATAKTQAAQPISGVGDDAFYDHGRLTFKKNGTYVTIEVISTRIDTSTPEGVNQQIEIEKRLADKALSRMG